MNQKEIIRKYPRLTRVLLAISSTVDPTGAADVIQMSKDNWDSFAHSLVNEAWHLRHQYIKDVEAKRIVSEFLDTGESTPPNSSPTSTYDYF